MISIFSPINKRESLDHENMDRVMNSSPMKLIDGGKARFIREAVSHHSAISGIIDCKPRARIIVRL